jgi:carbon monoxide dehydrogenase subunit G
MRFTDEATIAAAVDELWALVDDLESLGWCIPGATSVLATGPSSLHAEVHQRVGPIGLRFGLEVRVAEIERPNRAVVEIEGADPRVGARVRQRQEITFEAIADGTVVRIEADVQVTGRLATFGQRVIEAKARELVEEMLRNITELIRTRRPGETTSAAPPAEEAVGDG